MVDKTYKSCEKEVLGLNHALKLYTVTAGAMNYTGAQGRNEETYSSTAVVVFVLAGVLVLWKTLL